MTDEDLSGGKLTFREVLALGGRGTLGVVLGLLLLDSVDGALFAIFSPEIRESLGLSAAAIAIVAALNGAMVAVGALPLGLLGDRRSRSRIAGVCTFVWAGAAVLLGLVQSFGQLVVARVLGGIGKATEGPIQSSMLTDAYPPAGRGRVLGLHRAAQPLGIIAGPIVAALFATVVPERYEPWRWAFGFLAVMGVVVGWAALRLREPVRGRFEGGQPVGDGTRPAPAAGQDPSAQQDPAVGQDPSARQDPSTVQYPSTRPVPVRNAFARLAKIRTYYFVMVALGAFGLCVTTVPIYLNQILEDQLQQGPAARGVIAAVCAVGGLAGAALAGIFSDRLIRRSPAASLHLAGAALATLGIGFAVQAYAPDTATYVLVGMLTQALTFGGIVPLSLAVAAVTPPRLRATAFALVGLSLALIGGLGGAVLTSVAEQIWGIQGGIAVVAPTASVLAGLVLVLGARHLRRDIANVAAETATQAANQPANQAAGEVATDVLRQDDVRQAR